MLSSQELALQLCLELPIGLNQVPCLELKILWQLLHLTFRLVIHLGGTPVLWVLQGHCSCRPVSGESGGWTGPDGMGHLGRSASWMGRRVISNPVL